MTATTIPTPITAPATGGSDGASFLSGTLAIAGRTLRAFVRTPQQIVFGTIAGAMFLLLFRYVFGGAISTPGLDYVDFIVPGFLVSGILFGGQESAVGVAADMESGLFDRLRSLPIHRTSVLAGRSLADVGRLAWSTTATALIGVAIGFRPSGSVAELALAAVLVLTYGLAFSWVFTTMGLVSGSAQGAQGLSMLVFPLSFISSANVPVDSMPGWMQPVAEHNPVTSMVNSVRSLTGGGATEVGLPHGTAHWVLLSLAWCAAITAVFAPLAVRRFTRR
ncbi:ABC transporter permease [Iamia sp. SCSIO 61187]|uniref:ABC transporter permease n=1 Tax=Iamia sp. SCSIO 61187 TaxID=2722752 RepID=UPI001C62A2C3|nr:ABC transporter permease [Iamia sp. SCSIO 61187]QYG91414.1 ABC transporter permease [Iamia sp. SCSIO 61187]